MSGTAVFSEEAENLLGEAGRGSGETEEGMDVGGLVLCRRGCRAEAKVKGKSEGAADSGHATDNIGAVDWTTVPGICGGMGGFHEDFVSTAVVGSDGDSLVEKAVEFFDANSFVVTSGSDMNVNV